jgi:predicted amidohydrolase
MRQMPKGLGMNNKITVAAIQLKPASTVDENLTNAEALLIEAADAGVQLALLPENFAHYGQSDFLMVGRDESNATGPVRQFLADQASRHGIWLVGGTIPVAGLNPKPFARSFLFDPGGNCVDHYDKIHLFDVEVSAGSGQKNRYCESDNFSPGKRVTAVSTGLAKIGLSVCYDLRFAELYGELAALDTQIVVVPAAFTAATGKDHWQLLLRARAIENQVFMIGANLVDRNHATRGLWGGSVIIDPWGTVLASLEGDCSGVAVAEIDLALIAKLQLKMPMRDHRRLPL